MNKTGQIAVQIFNDLDRRLRSTDKKDTIDEEPKVRGSTTCREMEEMDKGE